MTLNYDVFLSHNSRDKTLVAPIATALSSHNVRVWYDDNEIHAGDSVLDKIQAGLAQSRCIAVFIGPSGVSPTHEEEQFIAVTRAIKKSARVIPVFLPGSPAPESPDVPPYLTVRKWVRFERDVTEKDPMQMLLAGIRKGETRSAVSLPTAADRAAPEPTDDSSFDSALDDLIAAIERSGALTFFVGAGFASTPRPYEIARQLLTEAGLIRASREPAPAPDLVIEAPYRALLPWLDAAGTYYEASTGPTRLENRVVQLLREHAVAASPLHLTLAKIVARLSRLGVSPTPRWQGTEPLLMVTTGLDLSFERALLRAGVAFTRIVQHWSGSEITINEYKPGLSPSAGLDDRTPLREPETGASRLALDGLIATTGRRTIRANDHRSGSTTHPIRDLPFGQFQEPFLYKYHGSQDVPGSCALSTEHYFRLAVRPVIPDRLLEIIGNSSALYLPCGALDADVRHAYQTLIRRAYQVGREGLSRVAIVQPPEPTESDGYRIAEMQMWPRVVATLRQQMGIAVVEGSAEHFVSRLADRLDTEVQAP